MDLPYLNINDNFVGASYKQSVVIKFGSTIDSDQRTLISPLWPNFIAATLLHWVSSDLIFMVNFLTGWDARLITALRTLEMMIGLLSVIRNDNVLFTHGSSSFPCTCPLQRVIWVLIQYVITAVCKNNVS